ncbi:MAG: metallophosphoesterase family protein [Planctomycetota bacterium]|jgi:hypothetical protein
MNTRSILCLLIVAILATLGCESQEVNLLDGAAWRFSADGGETFSAEQPVIDAGQQADIVIDAEFDVADTDGIADLKLVADVSPWVGTTFALNGVAFDRPVAEMGYRSFAGIDPALLKPGRNVLSLSFGVINGHEEAKTLPAPQIALRPMADEDLAFQTGPVLGYFDETFFTITCRTTIAARVTLRMRPTDRGSGAPEAVLPVPHGLMHRFKAQRREGYEYRLEAISGETVRVTDWTPVPSWADTADGTLRFVIAGDSRTHPDRWRRVAVAIDEQDPQLMVFVGDMITDGRNDWEWDDEHFGPAAELVARTPYYPVIGNHEREAPVMRELFFTPAPDGRAWNWAQQIGDVLFVGIVGHWVFAPGGDDYIWLEQTLAESDAKFIIVNSHYPAWSSLRHGGVDENGEPYNDVAHQAQAVLMPLMAKYNVTAFVAGHDHFYERNEPPGGVTQIVAGGAGAPVYGKHENAEEFNPYSQAFAQTLHYCLFEVAGETCTMTVLTPDGEVVDTRTWQARSQADGS